MISGGNKMKKNIIIITTLYLNEIEDLKKQINELKEMLIK